MVKSVTSLTRNGLRDWIIQRVSSVIIAVYLIFILSYCFMHPDFEYADWATLFSMTAMRVFSLVALICIILHAWIGMWTIGTDYIKSMPARLLYEVIVAIVLLGCFIWGIQIFWGV